MTEEIQGKTVCVIVGVGSIGFSFIKEVLRFELKSVVVVDLNEYGLAELMRGWRRTKGTYEPDEFQFIVKVVNSFITYYFIFYVNQ